MYLNNNNLIRRKKYGLSVFPGMQIHSCCRVKGVKDGGLQKCRMKSRQNWVSAAHPSISPVPRVNLSAILPCPSLTSLLGTEAAEAGPSDGNLKVEPQQILGNFPELGINYQEVQRLLFLPSLFSCACVCVQNTRGHPVSRSVTLHLITL